MEITDKIPHRLWHLVARKMTNDITTEELKELEDILLKNAGLASAIDIHYSFFNTPYKDTISQKDLENLRRKMEKEFPKEFLAEHLEDKFTIIPGRRKKIIWAISCCFMLVVIISLASINSKTTDKQVANYRVESNMKIATAPKITETVLPDGSKVILNEKSNIVLDKEFGKANRNIYLDGEAFFDVTHNPQLPMIVHVGQIKVKVIGTVFNLRSYKAEKKVAASLIKGAIEITSVNDKKLKLQVEPNEKVIIHTGSISMLNQAQKDRPVSNVFAIKIMQLKQESQSGLIPEISWVENKLVFDEESFEDLADRLEQWYQVQIEINDENIKNKKFTGVFDNESISEALYALQISFPFDFKIKNNFITISKK